MEKTVVEYLHDHAKESPNKTAVIAEKKEVSYKRLFRLVDGYAAYLQGQGLGKGDIVAAKSSQSLAYVVIYLGVHLAGGVITSTEKSVPSEGLLAIAGKVHAKMIICNRTDWAADETFTWIDAESTLLFAEENRLEHFHFPKGEDSADILFTTGTTGASKGVELSHRALVSTAENLIHGCGYSKDTVIVVAGPLNHAGPIRKLISTIVNGSAIYILDGMTNLKAYFEALEYPFGKVACYLPPAAIRTILVMTGDTIQKYADRIDFIESSSAPLPEPLKERLRTMLPKTRLYNNYGTSESGSVCIYDYSAHPGKAGCIGKPMINAKMLVVDENRREIQSSKEHMGYLACKADSNMKGYLNEPELTKQVLSDGIVYSNDMGYMDEEGFLYLTGRKDDVINVGGLKVAPVEVEEAALAIEGINDCICIAVPHPITGQALKLLVVLEEGAEFSPARFTGILKQKLEGYKVPSKYEQVGQIARTYNGKLDRKAYR